MSSQYAVNAADFAVSPLHLRALIGPHIQAKKVVEAERGTWAGQALVLECDAEQAAAIIAVVRIKLRKAQFKFYQRDGGPWRMV